MMNSDTRIGLSHDYGGYELKEDLKESGALRTSCSGIIPQLSVWNPGDFSED